MANVIIKTDERKAHERDILQSFKVSGRGTPEQREAAEVISARTMEVMNGGKK
jgi:hypothetical protein